MNRSYNSVSLPQLVLSRFILFSLFCFVVSSAFQNPVPTHNIIFDEVGKMAASMTYIHVAIPLNISTFEDQISLFQYYLDHHFLTMTTNDSNAILFTKTIRDLAHFASLRLQYLADKVKYIDHLLPDESDSLGRQKRFPDDPDSLVREKRMMTLVPWIICMDELKTTKASTLEDERILRREIYKYIKENEWLRSEIHACRNPPYPDLPEFHATFKNSTYPQVPPPTNPIPPFSAFRPQTTNYWDRPDPLLEKPPKSVSPRSRHFRSYDPDSPWLVDELRQDRLVNTLPVFLRNYTEDDQILFANISEKYTNYLGDDLALDFIDP